MRVSTLGRPIDDLRWNPKAGTKRTRLLLHPAHGCDHRCDQSGTLLMKMNPVCVLAVAVSCAAGLLAQPSGWPPPPGHITLNIWPGTAPGEEPNQAAEADTTTAKDNLIAGK